MSRKAHSLEGVFRLGSCGEVLGFKEADLDWWCYGQYLL